MKIANWSFKSSLHEDDVDGEHVVERPCSIVIPCGQDQCVLLAVLVETTQPALLSRKTSLFNRAWHSQTYPAAYSAESELVAMVVAALVSEPLASVSCGRNQYLGSK
jgi:hypothetical protein